MTNKEINANVKKELKNAGYCAKDFRISVKDCLYDSSIRVTVKNPLIKLSDVKNILSHWESYELDQASGEILQGGNTYVFVQYDSHAFDNIPAEYTEKAASVIDDAEKYDGRQIAENKDGVSLHLRKEGNRFRLIECRPGTMANQQTTFFYDASQLSAMLFRFYNLGTAQA